MAEAARYLRHGFQSWIGGGSYDLHNGLVEVRTIAPNTFFFLTLHSFLMFESGRKNPFSEFCINDIKRNLYFKLLTLHVIVE